MLMISLLLALQHIAMYIGNHCVGVQGIALNLRHDRMHAHDAITSVSNSHVRIYRKLSLGVGFST